MQCRSARRVLVAVVVAVLLLARQHVSALINDRCDHHKSLECRVANAFCQPVNERYGLCTCDRGFKAARDESACLLEIGKKTCESHADCDVPNSACDTRGRCACRHKYMVSRDKTECLPPLGRSCDTSADCTNLVADSRCEHGVCSCQNHYVASRNRTLCLPVLGTRCLVAADCKVRHSYCDNGLCSCHRTTHVPSYNKTLCLPVVHRILAACEEDDQCQNDFLGQDTWCVNNVCMCRYGNTEPNETCSKRKELDDWCTHSQQCQMIERASCVQNKCSCDPYYVPFASNRTTCVPIAMLYGSPCVDHVQCQAGFGDGARCVESSCQCIRDHHFVINKTGRCVGNRGIGESCQLDECFLPLDGDAQKIQCVDNLCACRVGTMASRDNGSCSGAENIHSTHHTTTTLLILSAVTYFLTGL